jgi:peptidoglycan hydrolase-like protein with peptidoglycan-binding domain
MKIKIFTLVLLGSIIFNTAFALTQADIDLLVAAGFIPADKVATANNAVKNSNTSTTQTQTTQTPFVYGRTSTSSTSSCLKITGDLFIGSTGSVVTSLQNFLKSKGHFAESATGYYGAITQAAVEKFQKAEGIVLNGTPETTGLGKVGPATRSAIERISCAGSSATTTANNFFGYNLDDLFKPVNYDYNVKLNTDIAFDTNIQFNTDIAFDTRSSYKPMDVKLDTNVNFITPQINFAPVNYNTGIGDGVVVQLYAKAVNGQYLRGGNTTPVAVSSPNVELAWETTSAKDCVLTGDFKEKRLNVPVAGSAKMTLNSYSSKASNGDPLFKFKVSCNASTTKAYSLPDSDSIVLWIYNASSTSAQ